MPLTRGDTPDLGLSTPEPYTCSPSVHRMNARVTMGGMIMSDGTEHDLPAPDGLGPRALALWSGTVAGVELEAGEVVLLYEACRLVDDIDAMQAALDEQGPVVKGSRGQPAASPLIREIRGHKLAVQRILRTLLAAMPEEEDGRRLSPSDRGRKAAVSRWHGHRADGTVRQLWGRPEEAS